MASITFSKKFGMLLLGIWLIMMALREFAILEPSKIVSVIMGVLAIIAGIIIIIDR